MFGFPASPGEFVGLWNIVLASFSTIFHLFPHVQYFRKIAPINLAIHHITELMLQTDFLGQFSQVELYPAPDQSHKHVGHRPMWGPSRRESGWVGRRSSAVYLYGLDFSNLSDSGDYVSFQ